MCADILSPPKLDWRASGEPYAREFDDVYFAAQEGYEETRYVFLQHNQLEDRFATLAPHTQFCITETGFGSGLNFLATVALWQRLAPSSAHLHFVSIEKHPFTLEQLTACHQLWPQLSDLCERLRAVYPKLNYRGFHRCQLSAQVHLTLIFDEVHSALDQLNHMPLPGPTVAHADTSWSGLHTQSGMVQAWFLDGFAPAKNPDMWQDTLYESMAKLSQDNATFATFTAAGVVKRGLQAKGFHVQKSPGFGKKRDMLHGHFEKPTPPPPPPQAMRKGPKYGPTWHCIAKQNRKVHQVTVIGAGLAGAHTARALAEAGLQVQVFEKHSVASGGSGNPKGVLYTTLSQADSDFSQFNLASYGFAIQHYLQRDLFAHAPPCGVLEVAEDRTQAASLQALANTFCANAPTDLVEFLSPEAASAQAGVNLAFGALHFKHAGWLNPKAVCQALLNHANIQVFEDTEIADLSLATQWRLTLANGQHQHADAVVLCCAHQSLHLLSQKCELPLNTIRGQVSMTAATDRSQTLNKVLCGSGYICPPEDGRHCLGATFDLREKTLAVTQKDHQLNLDKVKTLSPDLQDFTSDDAQGRAAFRCTSPDYLPIVGPVPKEDALASTFGKYRDNANFTIDQVGDYWPGLYVNVAHGSRGLTYTPLCAQLLLAQLKHSPLPMTRRLALALHPARFIIRELVNGKR